MPMKKWKLREEIDSLVDKELRDYPELVRKLLFYRGIKTKSEAEVFLAPNYERDLLDPFLMVDMEKGVERFLEAISNGEKIIIWGDYDADGVPGAAILSSFLQKIEYKNFDVYIPDRHNEAYGLNPEIVSDFAEHNVKLIITIDCGITDVAEVKLAREKGIDVIITDHHLVGVEVPEAYAVIDAKRVDDNYPYKFLSGAGVIFKFVCAVLQKKRFGIAVGWEKWLLDFVAISTVSDMVSLTGENRMLVHYGLKVLRQTRRLGLLALLNVAKIKPINLSEDDLGFMVGPRINSASRMSHASQAYFLLTTDNEAEAVTIAKHLEEKNKERRDSVEIIIKEIETIFDQSNLPPIIVAGSPSWGLGVLGLTSSRLVEKYARPVWLWSKNNAGIIKGSCRSDGSINVVEVMNLAGGKEFFLDHGGHPMAGGFSLAQEKEGELNEHMLKGFAEAKKNEVETELVADYKLPLEQLNWTSYRLVEPLAPFGVDNQKPIFWLSDLEISNSKSFGNGGIHLELVFKKPDGAKISAIGFFQCLAGEFDALNGHSFHGVNLKAGERVDCLATLECSTFKNYPELRLRIVDLRKAG